MLDPDRPHRRSIRLPAYDYRQPGAYFVTICTREGECVLDDPIVSGIIRDVWQALPTHFPTIALDEFVVMPNHIHLIVWLYPPDGSNGAGASRAPTTEVDVRGTGVDVGATLAVAPETWAEAKNGAGASPAPTDAVGPRTDWVIPDPEKVNVHPTLGDVIGAFKSLVFTVYLGWIQTHDPTRRAKFWQRNYYEHIVRNERELNAIRQYIAGNPDRWAWDTYNPSAGGPDLQARDLWHLLEHGTQE